MRKLFSPSLALDRRIAVLTVTSTLLLIINAYHTFTPWIYVDRVILFLFIPLAITLVVFRESPGRYGFTFGDWKAGLLLTLGGIVLMTPILWFLTRSDSTMRTYYSPHLNANLPIYTFLDLIGWEFIFRGWLLFGYARKFGPEALWLQAVPFALAHIGKPEVETISTIFGGFAFGWVAWRTRSFIYPFLIHWYIAAFTILVAGGTFV
jgi:membrane protease YdiL (CAAX protease family)